MLSVSQTVTASGDTVLLPAPSSGHYQVLGIQITSLTAIDRVTLKAGSTRKFGTSSTAVAGGGISCAPSPVGYFSCLSGTTPTNLQANLSGAGTVEVNVQYRHNP